MFANYIKSKFEDDVKNAQEISTKARSETQYKINDAVIEYVVSHNLVVRDVESFLLDTDIKTSKQLTILGYDIFIHANNISNIIAGFNIFVSLFTNVKNKDFTIMLDRYPYINLYNMQINIIDKSKTLIYYPAELELIQTYKTLYSPLNFGEWEACKVYCKELESLLSNKSSQKKITSKSEKAANIIMELTKDQNAVIIGSFAAFKKLNIECSMPLHVITTDLFISDALAELRTHFSNIETKTYDISLYVMPELRLVKTNVIANGENIVSFFNNITFELIPFEVIDGYKIADVNVTLCHLMIDYYTYKKNNMEEHAAACFGYFEQLRNTPSIQVPQYLGIYSDLNIYRRKKGTYNEYGAYTPEDVRYNTGTYREIKFRQAQR